MLCWPVKADVTREEREVLAGKAQAAQEAALASPFSDRVRWFLHELDNVPTGKTFTRTDLLRKTYVKTGCNPIRDGPEVCPTCPPLRAEDVTRIWAIRISGELLWCKRSSVVAVHRPLPIAIPSAPMPCSVAY